MSVSHRLGARRPRRALGARICVLARATRVRDEAAVSTDDAFAVDDRVGAIFPYVAASGAFMALWVFGPFPGSAYTGIADHDRWLTGLYEWAHFPSVFGVTSLITKYLRGGTMACTPSRRAWGAVVRARALQLHPKSREMFGGALHRASGRLMLAAAATLMVGYGVIDHNHLSRTRTTSRDARERCRRRSTRRRDRNSAIGSLRST